MTTRNITIYHLATNDRMTPYRPNPFQTLELLFSPTVRKESHSRSTATNILFSNSISSASSAIAISLPVGIVHRRNQDAP